HVLHYDRASDPWTSIGADGTAYAIAIAFDALDYRNAVGAATSSTGGRTWLHVRPIIEESDTGPSTPFNDKESITADPTVPGVAYAVWDRLLTVDCGGSVAPAAPRTERPLPRGVSPLACFKGPTYFSRTTDGGHSWSKPRVIVPLGVNQQTIGNVIVVDPATDELYDFYNYFDGSNWFEDVIHTLGPASGQNGE